MENRGDVAFDINILIVDDNQNNLIAMKKILSGLGATLHCASSGLEALKLTLRYRYAVIFLDVQMPDMDGYEVAKCLSQNHKTEHTPIVFITAILSEPSHILNGYDSGAIDYLTKPINSKILIAKAKAFIKLFKQQEQQEQSVKKLVKLANNDSLTGLANRYQFNSYFQKLFLNSERYKRHFALLLLDLDDFKIINDRYGHDAGDKVLQVIANKLKVTLRGSDLVARLGGMSSPFFCLSFTPLWILII